MSIIITEGCDKVGKSVLCHHLSKQLSYKIIKCNQPDPKVEPYIEYISKLLEHGDNVIFDRFLYGELVYGPIFRKKSQLTPTMIHNLELLLKARDSTLIYCYADPDFIKQKFKEEGETFTSLEQVDEILRRYEELLPRVTIKLQTHKIPTESWPTVEIRKIPQVLIDTRYVGDLEPQVLFVGERNNLDAAPKYKEVSLPFDFGRSSTILWNLIREVELTSFGVTNVYKHHLELTEDRQLEVLRTEVETLKPGKVIALGSKAYRSLTKAGVKSTLMWHPSFLGRFKSAQQPDYIKKLLLICNS